MNDFGFLYFQDKDTGEYKLLGKANIVAEPTIEFDSDDTVDEGSERLQRLRKELYPNLKKRRRENGNGSKEKRTTKA